MTSDDDTKQDLATLKTLLPIIRRIIPGTIASDLTGVQRMSATDEETTTEAMEALAVKLLAHVGKLRALGLDDVADDLIKTATINQEVVKWIDRQQKELGAYRTVGRTDPVERCAGPDVQAMGLPPSVPSGNIFTMKYSYKDTP